MYSFIYWKLVLLTGEKIKASIRMTSFVYDYSNLLLFHEQYCQLSFSKKSFSKKMFQLDNPIPLFIGMFRSRNLPPPHSI